MNKRPLVWPHGHRVAVVCSVLLETWSEGNRRAISRAPRRCRPAPRMSPASTGRASAATRASGGCRAISRTSTFRRRCSATAAAPRSGPRRRGLRQVRPGRRRARLAAGPDAVLDERGSRARDYQEHARHPRESRGQAPDRLGDADLRLVGEHHRLSRRGQAHGARTRSTPACPTCSRPRPARW